MATHWGSILLCSSDSKSLSITRDSSKTILRLDSTDFTLDSVCASTADLWASLEPHVVGNVEEGIGTCVLFIGDSEMVHPTLQATAKEAVRQLQPTERMKMLEISRSGIFSGYEINSNDKVRDILEKDSSFADCKIRGGKLESISEVSTDSNAIEYYFKWTPQPDSCIACDITYRLSTAVQVRHSQVLFMSIPTTAADGKRRGAGSSLISVLDALYEQSNRKKKSFVPYRLSAVTQILSEPFNGNPSKVIIVGCVRNIDDPESFQTVKLLHRSRLITSILRGSEESVSDHHMKNVIEKLKRKVADIPLTSTTQLAPPTAIDDKNIAHKRLTLQQREMEMILAKKQFEEAQQALSIYQNRLNDAKRSASSLRDATTELERLFRMSATLDKKLATELQLSEEVEDSMEEARVLEQEVTAENEARRALKEKASADRATAQAKTLASVFRAAHQNGLDLKTTLQSEADASRLKNEISSLTSEIDQLDVEISSAKQRLSEVEVFARDSAEMEQRMEQFQDKIVSEISNTLQCINEFATSMEGAVLENFEDIENIENSFLLACESDEHKIRNLKEKLEESTRQVSGQGVPKLTGISPELQQAVDALCCLVAAEEDKAVKLDEERNKLDADIQKLQKCAVFTELKQSEKEWQDVHEKLIVTQQRYDRLSKNSSDLYVYVQGRERL